MGDSNQREYLNELLIRDQQRMWEQALLDANREEACTGYQQEFATWEQTLGDGLESS